MIKMRFAVLLSGGIGTRISSDIPKQYIRIAGHMIVTHALSVLLDSDHIDAVYIVAEQEWRDPILEDVKDTGLDTGRIQGFAPPGKTRQLSILNAMQLISKDSQEKDTILIHDAARPLLTEELLEKCYKALSGHDGVMPVLPMKDTVYLSDDRKSVSELLDRSKVFAGQAPELFYFKPYYEANMKLMPDKILEINGASEPAVMAGMDIVMIPGDERNFKVTTDADMERFRRIMEDAG